MSLAFLSPAPTDEVGKVELRGDVASFEAERIARLTPRRAIVLCPDAPALVARARAAGLRAYDVSGALTAIPVESDALLRRLTEVEVDAPTAAPVAGDVTALIFPLGDERYELYVPRELAEYVADVVADLREGLA
ncbi:MAG: hypothetical protein ACXWZB_04805 [Gaiellaceae bacterium]